MNLKILIIDKNINIPVPVYSTKHASGLDISSASIAPIQIEPLETVLVPTNIKLEIPEGYEGQIRPRSGLAMKHNIGILNSPGTIDSDYRGELKILLTNFGKNTFTISFGERIAQLVICKIERAEIIIEESLSETKRNEGGFGHTGV